MVKKEYNFYVETGGLGKVLCRFVVAMAKGSDKVFSLGQDVEKYSGLSLKDAMRSGEDESDGYFHALTNVMNGGEDIFFYVNAQRHRGVIKDRGELISFVELLSHESVHIARMCIVKQMLKSKDWVNMKWSCIGEDSCGIDEESFATVVGEISGRVINDLMVMYKKIYG